MCTVALMETKYTSVTKIYESLVYLRQNKEKILQRLLISGLFHVHTDLLQIYRGVSKS